MYRDTLRQMLTVIFLGPLLLLLKQVKYLMASVQTINSKLDALSADVDRLAGQIAGGSGVATQADLDQIDSKVAAIQVKVAALPGGGSGSPGVPGGAVIRGNGTNAVVELLWDASANATSYNVKRSTTSNTEVTVGTTNVPSYNDNGTVNGNTYFYKISAVNAAGVESANSAELSVTV